jgi:HD superfamily phosphohydrolase YqeK
VIPDNFQKRLNEWFSFYTGSFTSSDADLQFNLTLKREHSLRVVDEIVAIGKGLGFSEYDQAIASIAALLHDVGRFEQYARYKTFVDRDSVDHALLGVDLLRKQEALTGLDPLDRELVLTAIEHHSQAAVPDSLTERERFFCRLLRDADKLDIIRILTDRYREATLGAKSAIELLLPQGGGISSDALADLMAGAIVKFSHVKKADDFKLLQMAWVFDMNFAPSLRIFKERGYLEALRDALPETEEMRNAYAFVKKEMEKRVREGE